MTTFIPGFALKFPSARSYGVLSTCFLLTLPAGTRSHSPPFSVTATTMTRERDFAAALAKTKHSPKEVHRLVNEAYPDSGLTLRSCQRICSEIRAGKTLDEMQDKRKLNAVKTRRTDDVVELVRADIEENRRVTIGLLARGYQMSRSTMHALVSEQLGLAKKSARWIPKMLSEEQRMERVRCSAAFLELAGDPRDKFLDMIVTMDESAVSLHTPETKKQSKQWITKGQPGPLKAKVQASRDKQMIMAFFDNKGMIFYCLVPKDKTVNGAFVIDVLKRFLKAFRRKRPEMASNQWFLHWDNAPVHTARNVQAFLEEKHINVLEHPPYSPDLAPADYFLFPRMKSDLAGLHMTRDTFKIELERVLRNISKDDFATAFQRWIHRHKKCIQIDGTYVEKN